MSAVPARSWLAVARPRSWPAAAARPRWRQRARTAWRSNASSARLRPAAGGGNLNSALGLNRLRRPRGGFGFGDLGIGFRNAALGDRGDGAIGGALGEIFRKQVAHGGIARTAAAASEHHADQMAVAAAHRGHEIEAGGAGVAGLDAVDALDIAEQAVVIADRMATIDEARGGEVAIIAREAFLDRAAERRLIARGGDLLARWAGRWRCDTPSCSCRARAPCASSAWRNRLRRRKWLPRSRRTRRWPSASPVP